LRISERDSQAALKIYLFSVGGQLLWSNVDETSSESILLSAFIASLYSFSKEFLIEDLYELQINELRISLHSILDKFLVAILFNKNDIYYSVTSGLDKELDKHIEKLIKEFTETTPHNSVFEIDEESFETFLISLLEELTYKIEKEYDHVMDKTIGIIYSFSSMVDSFESKGIGIALYYQINNSLKKLFNYYSEDNKGLKRVVDEIIEKFSNEFMNSNNKNPTFFYYNGIFTMIKKKDNFVVILSKRQDTIDSVVFPTYDYLNKFFEQEIVPVLSLKTNSGL